MLTEFEALTIKRQVEVVIHYRLMDYQFHTVTTQECARGAEKVLKEYIDFITQTKE